MWYEKLAYVLAAIGAINWGLAELGWNLVEGIFMSWAGATVVAIIYYLVALSGLYVLYMAFAE